MAIQSEQLSPQPPAGVCRRVGAIVYDSLLLAALLLLGSVPPVLLNSGPLRDGTPLAGIKNALYFVYLLLLVFIFYGWFWTRHGQTLGMAAWRIRVLSDDGSLPSWKQTLIRLCTAFFGLANLWVWVDRKHRGWHELLSRTKTVHAPQINP